MRIRSAYFYELNFLSNRTTRFNSSTHRNAKYFLLYLKMNSLLLVCTNKVKGELSTDTNTLIA